MLAFTFYPGNYILLEKKNSIPDDLLIFPSFIFMLQLFGPPAWENQVPVDITSYGKV